MMTSLRNDEEFFSSIASLSPNIQFFQFQFIFVKPTQHDLNTNPNDITTSPSLKDLPHETYQLFLEQKRPLNFIFQKKTNLPKFFHTTNTFHLIIILLLVLYKTMTLQSNTTYFICISTRLALSLYLMKIFA